MARVIHKYRLDENSDIPHSPKILFMGLDPHQNLCVWMEVNTNNTAFSTIFHRFGTGQEIPADARYIGSLKDRMFMWHYYALGWM